MSKRFINSFPKNKKAYKILCGWKKTGPLRNSFFFIKQLFHVCKLTNKKPIDLLDVEIWRHELNYSCYCNNSVLEKKKA